MAHGIRPGHSWPQSSVAADDLHACEKVMGHIQRKEMLQESTSLRVNAKSPTPGLAMHPAASVRALWGSTTSCLPHTYFTGEDTRGMGRCTTAFSYALVLLYYSSSAIQFLHSYILVDCLYSGWTETLHL